MIIKSLNLALCVFLGLFLPMFTLLLQMTYSGVHRWTLSRDDGGSGGGRGNVCPSGTRKEIISCEISPNAWHFFFLLLSKGFAFFPSRSRRLLATLAAIIVLPSALLLGPLFSPPPSSRACSFFVRLSRLPSPAGLRREWSEKREGYLVRESARALLYRFYNLIEMFNLVVR